MLVAKRKAGTRRNDPDGTTRAADAAVTMPRLVLFNKSYGVLSQFSVMRMADGAQDGARTRRADVRAPGSQ